MIPSFIKLDYAQLEAFEAWCEDLGSEKYSDPDEGVTIDSAFSWHGYTTSMGDVFYVECGARTLHLEYDDWGNMGVEYQEKGGITTIKHIYGIDGEQVV